MTIAGEIFWILFISCSLTMIACRVLPAFVLRGRQLSDKFQLCLKLIAPAAFAGLVANDLFSVDMFDSDIWAGVLPLIAALVVFIVAYKTKSLLVCALAGIGIYAVLYYFVAL